MFTIVIVAILLSLVLFAVSSVSPRFSAWLKDTLKWMLICGVTVAVFTVVLFSAWGALAEDIDIIYPTAAVVISVEQDGIVVEDGEGNIWSFCWDFEEDPDIELGDIIALLMWDSGTPDYIFDDEVVDAVNTYIKAE